MERNVSAREFQEWRALYEMEPWGDDWHQASLIAAVSQSVWSKGGRIKTDKFVPRARQRRDPQQIEMEMRQFAAQHNARLKKS